jgi:hypothetical protein
MKAHAPGRRKSQGTKGIPGLAAPLSIEAVILGVLRDQGQMRIEQLVRALPGYTWRQVFNAVDVLRRDAVLTITQPDPLSYRPLLAIRGNGDGMRTLSCHDGGRIVR